MVKQTYTTSIQKIETGPNIGKCYIVGSIPFTCTHEKPGVYEVIHVSNIYDSEEDTIAAIMADPLIRDNPQWKIQLSDYTVWTAEQITRGEHNGTRPLNVRQQYEKAVKSKAVRLKRCKDVPLLVNKSRYLDGNQRQLKGEGYRLIIDERDTGLFVNRYIDRVDEGETEDTIITGDGWVLTMASGFTALKNSQPFKTKEDAMKWGWCVDREFTRSFVVRTPEGMSPDKITDAEINGSNMRHDYDWLRGA